MNWKVLDENLRQFADQHHIDLNVDNINYMGGQITNYRLNDNNKIYFELKHTKPISEYGSKFRIYSRIPESKLKIIRTNPWIGKPKLKIIGLNHNEITDRLHALSKHLKSFIWETNHGYLSWPKEFSDSHFLAFECKSIDLNIEQFNEIRNIHIALTQYLQN